MRDLNVLSLFDGMSCGMIALRRLGLPVGRYFASEIDKYAIQVSQDNWLEIEHIGSVVDVSAHKLPVKIDLLIGGSPCQGFSFAGKQLNFEDERSKLFFEFVRIWEEVKAINPDAKFLLENVKMKKEHQDVISKYMGVEPIEINSALVSAQNRKRLYWFGQSREALQNNGRVFDTYKIEVAQPEDKGILLKDIVHEFAHADRDKSYCIDASYAKGGNLKQYFDKSRRQIVFETIEKYIVPFDKTLKILEKEIERGKVGYFRQDSQANRVYYIHDKAVTLCGDAGGGAAKMGQYLFGEIYKSSSGIHQAAESTNFGNQPRQTERVYNISGKSPALTLEASRTIVAVPIGVVSEGYLFGCITPDRIDKRQNGQRFSEGKKFYTLTAQGQHGILIEGYIRKLTPVECERLQTIEDNYSACVSNTQRYKMLGNGWNVDTIVHILKNLDPL